jgi:hypothetical protein
MNDCSNAEIRDQLPDLLHERLDVSARAVVLAHVDGCTDCRDELELLRGLRGALTARTPRVDIAYVVGALPKAPKPTTVSPSIPAHQRRWTDWRVAAAVTVLVAGGSSLALLNRASVVPDSGIAIRSVPVIDTPASIAPATPASVVVPSTKETASGAPQMITAADDQDTKSDAGPDGRFGGLTGAQLKALLDEIDHLEAVPVTEPEPVIIKVNVGTPAPLPELKQ